MNSSHPKQASERNTDRGFSLVELLLVLGVILTLSLIGFSVFPRIQASARQAEPQTKLREYATNMRAVQAQSATFVCSDATHTCGWTPAGQLFYSYYFDSSTADLAGTGTACASITSTPTQTVNGFLAVAAANIDGDATCDEWTVDQDGVLIHVTDDVVN